MCSNSATGSTGFLHPRYSSKRVRQSNTDACTDEMKNPSHICSDLNDWSPSRTAGCAFLWRSDCRLLRNCLHPCQKLQNLSPTCTGLGFCCQSLFCTTWLDTKSPSKCSCSKLVTNLFCCWRRFWWQLLGSLLLEAYSCRKKLGLLWTQAVITGSICNQVGCLVPLRYVCKCIRQQKSRAWQLRRSQDLSDIQWRVFRESVPAATASMLLFVVLKRLVWLLYVAHMLQVVSGSWRGALTGVGPECRT